MTTEFPKGLPQQNVNVAARWKTREASTHIATRGLIAPDGKEFHFPWDTDTDQILSLRDYLNERLPR